MRLISQGGMNGIYDIPYEKCLVYICGDKKTIKVQPLGELDSEYVFATYSNTDKALKVMEMLRKAYSRFTNTYNIIFKFPSDEEVEV